MKLMINTLLTFTILFSLTLNLPYLVDHSMANSQNIITSVLKTPNLVKGFELDSILPNATAQPIKTQVGSNLICNDGKIPNAVTGKCADGLVPHLP